MPAMRKSEGRLGRCDREVVTVMTVTIGASAATPPAPGGETGGPAGQGTPPTDGRSPIPFGVMADAFISGEVVPFLGAGASAIYRPGGTDWGEGENFLPFGYELAEHLARAVAYPDERSNRNLPLVASYFEHVASDRRRLNQRLRRVFASRGEPGSVHRLLAGIDQPLLIITTNYDDLMERAFGDRPFVLIVDRGEGNRIWVRRGDGAFAPAPINDARKWPELRRELPVVYKLHGSTNPAAEGEDSFLITEQDYVDFLGRAKKCVPAYFMDRMAEASFLFLGYSLADWNVRVLLRKLRQQPREAGPLRSWAVTRNAGPADEAIWRAHGINMYDADLKWFVRILAKELRIDLGLRDDL